MENISEKLRDYGLVLVAHLSVIVFWHFFVVLGDIKPYIMPSPIATLQTLFSPDYKWGENTLVTATEIFGGYALGVLAGVSMALVFSWVRILNAVFFPLFVSLNMIPKVALGPLFIVWFSYGLGSNIIISFSICFFPILLNTSRGLREIEPDLIDLVRSLQASRWQIFTKIQLPGALPYIFSGMKVGSILAVAGAVVGEFIASDKGLGYLMIQVQSTLDTAAMFMAVILLSLVGVALYLLVIALERIFVVQDARVQ
ncbi:MAG: ABC transporter permease [Hyphomicrobiales bacterium]|nr:ABC transporter permease [Hyphomicrobiales bacterium]MCP5372277.1 ABC transporter permease [Hyphomicrobiales bacterium]